MVERFVDIEEARGSIPLGSTKMKIFNDEFIDFCKTDFHLFVERAQERKLDRSILGGGSFGRI